MKNMSPLIMKDFYKCCHFNQYPEKTTFVYSNFTPRSSRVADTDGVVVFGVQYFLKRYLVDEFNEGFFKKSKDEVIKKYKRRLDNALGKDSITTKHIEQLHDLGYLPIRIKALPEGSICPLNVPCLTIENTKPDFFWLTNFLETLLSTVLWLPMTSATTAYRYRKLLDEYAKKTSDIPEFVSWQGHDFSMRGMPGVEAACVSGSAHLLSFTGTDTIPAIDFLEEYYFADAESELIGGSVPATEHSVMSMGLKDNEIGTFERIFTKIYPKGVVSIVSDTWDYWKVLTEFLPKLKDKILNRDGKVVIRPDSSPKTPVEIICGDNEAEKDSPQYKGSVEVLWEIFGGQINSKGYKQLDAHIGLIYGDSITYERAKEICIQLEKKGFASTNVVYGIGSFTYQYVTRDTYGFAMKATYGEVDGEGREIFKDPKTDSGMKKSARGLLAVNKVNNKYELTDRVSREKSESGELVEVFNNGRIMKNYSLREIRFRLRDEMNNRKNEI